MPTAEHPKAAPSPRISKSTEVTLLVLGHLGRLDQQKDGASLAGLANRLGMNDETLRPYLNGLIKHRKIYQDEVDKLYYLDPDGPPVRSTRPTVRRSDASSNSSPPTPSATSRWPSSPTRDCGFLFTQCLSKVQRYLPISALTVPIAPPPATRCSRSDRTRTCGDISRGSGCRDSRTRLR